MEREISVREILALGSELGGVAVPEFKDGQPVMDEQTGQQARKILLLGLLGHKMSMKTRLKVNELFNIVQATQKEVDEVRNERIKAIGTQREDGSYEVQAMVIELDEDEKVKSTTPNPALELFNKEYGELLKSKREINFSLTVKDIEDIETSEHYPNLFELLSPSKK